MITRLAHVCLNVRNLQASVDFYCRLGLHPVFRFTKHGKPFGVYLQIAPHNFIELFEQPGMDAPVNTGLLHFCLETDHLDTLMSELRVQGISFTDKKLGCDGTWQIWLKDPDGNAFEVHQYTEASLQYQGGTVEADW